VKVVIIDDEKGMHLIMKRMLAKVVGVEIVGSFLETSTAYSFLTNHDVDLIFLDINMPKESGLEFAGRLREAGRQMKIVFVTSHKEYALSAFDVYAYDYMVKPVVQERLQHTVQRAVSEMLSEKKTEDKFLNSLLTEQEKRVLLLINKGMANKEIAHQMHVTGETVKSHIKNLYRKLEAQNRVQALQRAKQFEILK
jgi:DNA-binding NarL/FixJ family response regulator